MDSCYAIVSAVKDEAVHVRRTLESVIAQTVRPVRWIIVDDGSRDGAPEIVERYTRDHAWITLLRLQHDRARQPGSAVIRAFQAGYELLRSEEFDLIVKLDCDLELPADYFEALLSRFAQEPRLGIASGVYLEQRRTGWFVVPMPAYHAAGASKAVRKACFEQIGGFIPARGWDTVDEIKAQALGWQTRHFPELQFYHLKSEGSGIGQVRTNVMLGEIYHQTGGGALFFSLKLLHRAIVSRPPVVGAVVMLYGYLRSVLSRRPLLVSDAEARHYRRLLNQRLLRAARTPLVKVGLASKDWSYS